MWQGTQSKPETYLSKKEELIVSMPRGGKANEMHGFAFYAVTGLMGFLMFAAEQVICSQREHQDIP